jgi:long-chain fatty acid transport protein
MVLVRIAARPFIRRRGARFALAVALGLGVGLFAAPRLSRAGGFYVPEVGPRAVGLAGAMTANDADPSAIFHNPAGLVGVLGTQVQAASGMFFPDVSFFRRPLTDPSSGETVRFDRVDNTNPLIVAPYLGASTTLGATLTAGVAIYAPFGATLEFPGDGAQRQIVTKVGLRTIFVSPTLAWRGPAGLRLGAALNLIYGDLAIEQKNALPYVTGDPEQYPDPDAALEGTTELSGVDPFSVGASLGLQWAPPGRGLVLGASVMTPVTLALDGDARIENSGITILTDDSGQMLQPEGRRDDTVKMSMPLPLILRLGVKQRLGARLTVLADLNWQRWSTSEALVVDFQGEYSLLPSPGANLYDVRVEQKWNDSFSARLAAELMPTSKPLTVRAGVLFDQSPVDDRHFGLLTPDSDKLGASAGVSWTLDLGRKRGHLDLDLAAMHLFLRERNIAPGQGGAPGSDGTILNKPAASFFHGVTRAGFDVVTLALTWRY